MRFWLGFSGCFLYSGKILVLAAAFFYLSSNLKSIGKLIFPAFGKVLVLGSVFSIQILIPEVLEHFFSFWQILGFDSCFFLVKFQLENKWKSVFQLLARPWF